jgi:small subunit ribosomal protein S4
MSRYLGPKVKITRRLGNLPGLTQKTTHKNNPPGEQGSKRSKPSAFAVRLQEKQKIRYHYGLTEKQLQRYVKQSKKKSKNSPKNFNRNTGELLLHLLQTRLDTIVYRLAFAPTIPAARQMVNHGHIKVNNKKIDIASYQCSEGEEISVVKDIHGISGTSTSKTFSQSYTPDLTPEIKQLLIIEYYSNIK